MKVLATVFFVVFAIVYIWPEATPYLLFKGDSSAERMAPSMVTRLSEEESAKLNVGYTKPQPLSQPVASKEAPGMSKYANYKMERELIDAARKAKFPEAEMDNLLRHAHCESQWDKSAINRGYVSRLGKWFTFHGPMQIWEEHYEKIGPLIGTRTKIEFIQAMHTDMEKHMVAVTYLWNEDKKNPMFGYIRDGFGPWKDTLRCRNKPTRFGVPWDEIIYYHFGDT